MSNLIFNTPKARGIITYHTLWYLLNMIFPIEYHSESEYLALFFGFKKNHLTWSHSAFAFDPICSTSWCQKCEQFLAKFLTRNEDFFLFSATVGVRSGEILQMVGGIHFRRTPICSRTAVFLNYIASHIFPKSVKKFLVKHRNFCEKSLSKFV